MPTSGVTFTMKMDTDLFALAKAKTHAHSLEFSKQVGLAVQLWLPGLATKACMRCLMAHPTC